MSLSFPILQPTSLGKRLWDFFLIVLITYSAIEVPLRIIFDFRPHGFLADIEYLVTVSFGIDIIINFLVPVSQNGKWENDPRRIAPIYLKTWFFIDFISFIPVTALTAPFPGLQAAQNILRLNRLARLLHMIRLDQVTRRLPYFARVNPAVMRLGFFVFWVLLCSHWIACGWLALNAGAPEAPLAAMDSLRQYVEALYWTITTIATVGYGDITPKTIPSMVYAMVVMILGAGMYGYIIGNIANMLANIDVAKAHFREKMERINAFMKYRHLPDPLQDRIRNYYNYLWEARRGYDEADVLADVPYGLMREVYLYLNSYIIQKVPLFRAASKEFIEELVMHLKPLIFTPGDLVVRKGEIGGEMFFISRGSVEVVSDDGSVVYAALREGNFFGEIALLLSVPRTATIRAADYCDLYTLDKENFERVLRKYPDFERTIREMADQRFRELRPAGANPPVAQPEA